MWPVDGERSEDVDRSERAAYERLIAGALARPVKGWDFGWLRRRAPIVSATPWNYGEVVAELAAGSRRMLDMGTGGGEVLSRLPVRAPCTVADEAWPPNVAVAAARLSPLGIPVVRDEGAPANAEQDGIRGRLPFSDRAFDLVINRHEAFLATEVFRVLRPGGSFVTQQVDTHSFDDFFVALGLEPPLAGASWLPLARTQLEEAGFSVITARTGEEHQAFGDVGAVVWYLRAVPWVLPDFDLVGFEPALRQVHRACAERPLIVRQRRLLVVAERPPAS
jgi:SAM-dependent methyltransferase